MKRPVALSSFTLPALALVALFAVPGPRLDEGRQASEGCGPRALAALAAQIRPQVRPADIYAAFPDGGRIASFSGLRIVGRRMGLRLEGFAMDVAEFRRRGGLGLLHLDARSIDGESGRQPLALGGSGAGGHFVAALGPEPSGGVWVMDPDAGRSERRRRMGLVELDRRWIGRVLVFQELSHGAP